MGIWRDKKRGDWCYKFMHLRREYGGRGFATKGEARSAREERRKQVKSPPPETQTGMGFLEAANLYLDWSRRRHAPGNIANKQVVLKRLTVFLGITETQDYPVRNVTPSVLDQFLSETPSANSYNNYRKEVSAMFSWVQKIHLPDLPNPCAKIEKLPNRRPERSIPTKQEFLQLMAAAGPDEKPLLIILAHSLARIDEILRLTWRDVNFEQGVLVLRTRKNAAGEWKDRIIPMNAELTGVLRSMWNRRRQDKWVFFNANAGTRYLRRPKFMHSICKRAGIAPLGTTQRKIRKKIVTQNVYYGFHAIRHFMATYLHDVMKVPTGVLSGILGHENKRTTEIYLHSVPEAASDALKKLEGIFDRKSVADLGGGSGGKDG